MTHVDASRRVTRRRFITAAVSPRSPPSRERSSGSAVSVHAKTVGLARRAQVLFFSPHVRGAAIFSRGTRATRRRRPSFRHRTRRRAPRDVRHVRAPPRRRSRACPRSEACARARGTGSCRRPRARFSAISPSSFVRKRPPRAARASARGCGLVACRYGLRLLIRRFSDSALATRARRRKNARCWPGVHGLLLHLAPRGSSGARAPRARALRRHGAQCRAHRRRAGLRRRRHHRAAVVCGRVTVGAAYARCKRFSRARRRGEEKRPVGVPKKRSLLDSSWPMSGAGSQGVLKRALAIVRDSEPRKTSLEKPKREWSVAHQVFLIRGKHRVRPPRGGPPRGRVERHDCSRWREWGRGARAPSTAFAGAVKARAPPDANAAAFAPSVETKNNPQRADADGLRRSARSETGAAKRPRDRLIAYLYPDARAPVVTRSMRAPDALPRRRSLRAHIGAARPVARRFFPRAGRARPNAVLRGSRAADDVPCDARAVRRPDDDAHPELVPSESPVSSLRADDVRRVAFWRSRRAEIASEVHLSQAPRRTFARIVEGILPVVWGSMREKISDWLSDWAANQVQRSRRSASKRKSLTPQERCPLGPKTSRNWREVIFWFELSFTKVVREGKAPSTSRTPHTARSRRPCVSPDRARPAAWSRPTIALPRAARRAARAPSVGPPARRAATSPAHCRRGPTRNRHLFALPVARAYAEGVAG